MITAVDYWNSKLELNALRSPPSGKGPDTDAGAFLAVQLEAGGDIIREMSKGRHASSNYVFEKYNRLKNNLAWRDWRDPLSAREFQSLIQIRKDIEGIPDESELIRKVKTILLAIADRKPYLVEQNLESLKKLIKENIDDTAYANVIPGTKTIAEFKPEVIERFEYPSPEEMKIGEMKITIPPAKGSIYIPPKQKLTAPMVLTQAEYERDWKPAGWKLLAIGPTSTWRQEWGMWEAIRDIVQNALDESESYQWGYDEDGLWISDQGRGVSVADFLLGPPKLKPDYARGRYGEGMKISTLVLVRAGYPVHITTVGKELWIVFLELDIDGKKSQQLNALYKSGGSKVGTTFHIFGYTGTAFEDRFAVNIPKDKVLWTAPSTITQPIQRYNSMYRSDFPDEFEQGGAGAGRIFARDIYMRDITSPFSYNLWSFTLAPDRHAPVNEYDMWVDVGRIWSTVNDIGLLESFLRMVGEPPINISSESRNLNMTPWDMGKNPVTGNLYLDAIKQNGEAWRKAWSKVYGDSVVIRTNDKFDNVIKHLGYSSVSLIWGVRESLSEVIMTDIKVRDKSQDKLRETVIVSDNELNHHQLVHISLAKAIADEIFHTAKVSGVYAAIIPPASDRVRTAGMYGTSSNAIYLSTDMLLRGRDTVDTLIHEMAHHRQWIMSGEAEDLTESHALSMTSIAAGVVEALSQHRFDDYLKDVLW